MNFFNSRGDINSLLKTLLMSLSVAALLAACGGQKGDQIPGDTPSRSVPPVDEYPSWEASMKVCREAKQSSAALPLSEYVQALHELADNQDEVCAMYGLGMLYLQGYEEFPAQPELARDYLQQASARGVTAAHRLLVFHSP